MGIILPSILIIDLQLLDETQLLETKKLGNQYFLNSRGGKVLIYEIVTENKNTIRVAEKGYNAIENGETFWLYKTPLLGFNKRIAWGEQSNKTSMNTANNKNSTLFICLFIVTITLSLLKLQLKDKIPNFIFYTSWFILLYATFLYLFFNS